MMKKNDIVTLTIDAVTNEGNGVGRVDGMAVFVPMTAPGDTASVRIVKLHKSYCYGIVEELQKPSPQRIASNCVSFKRCGGCTLRQLEYSCELEQKQKWVQDALRRLGGLDVPVPPVLPSPRVEGYRNKAQYPLAVDAQGHSFCGFYASRSHTVIPAEHCKLQPTCFGDICRVVCTYIDASGAAVYNEHSNNGLFRHLYIRQAEVTGERMVCLVINGSQIPQPNVLVERLLALDCGVTSIQLNHNTKNTNVILGEHCTVLHGNAHITDYLCGVAFDLSPLSFYQVNHDGAEQLYGTAAQMAQLHDGELLLDLYCGTGTIGLGMVKDKPGVTLVGVEVVESAVQNAWHNAQRAGAANARFIAGDAGAAAAQLATEGLHPAVVVLDPPRKGCDEATLLAVVQMKPTRIVMVSCNPATMARDAKQLCESGYAVAQVQPVDMFPRTNHVECCILLVGNVADKEKTYIPLPV